MTPPPFFIVGAQRSGTTLLFQILNTHSDLYVVNEFWDLYPFVTGTSTDWPGLRQLLETHLSLEAPLASERRAHARSAFEHIDEAFAQKLEEIGKKRWSIKHPRLTYYLSHFAEQYPEAQFIFIFRDGRASVSSNLRQRFNVANVYHGAKLWQEQVALQADFASRHRERCHCLKFEELIDDPEREIRAICSFLGVDFQDRLLDFHRARPETRVHEGNVNITRPIQPRIKEKWRAQLTPRQIAIIDSVAREGLILHGYPAGDGEAEISWLQRALFDLQQSVMTNYWWQRRTGWAGARRRLGLRRRAPRASRSRNGHS